MCKDYTKPKIKFLKEHLVFGYEENWQTYFIEVINEIPTGWHQDICKRHAAIGCKAKVEFSIKGRLLANAIWWDSELGEILHPDSAKHEFPLVSVNRERGTDTAHGEEVISLEGTGASTATTIPELKIPTNSDVIAEVSIISPSLKKPAISKWSIAIQKSYFSPIGIRRLA